MSISEQQALVFRFIYRTVRDRELASELTQEVLLKAYRFPGEYRPGIPYEAWILTIAKNHVRTYWQRKRLQTVSIEEILSGREGLPPAEFPSRAGSVAESFETKELADKCISALRRLPAVLREVFLLRCLEELTYEEIAELKKLPVGTVKIWIFRTKQRLRRHLERELIRPAPNGLSLVKESP